MCGRFTLYSHPEALEAYFGIDDSVERPPPRYTIAPGSQILAVRAGADGQRSSVMLHWGLIPSWAKDRKIGYRTINARGETVAEKPAFRGAFKSRRCIIPADGFYEWEATATGKQPYFIHRQDGCPLALAGLWETWTEAKTGEVIQSGTIIVTQANTLVGRIHDRMPVILEPRDLSRWLDPRLTGGPELQGLLRPLDSTHLAMYPVDGRIGKPVEDEPSLIRPIKM